MTVRRHAEELLDAPPSAVAESVRAVLQRKPPYLTASEVESGLRFVTQVRPNWWTLSTEMTIVVRPSLSLSGRTHLTADTKSQWFILGDIYGYYDGYLNSFVRVVRADLKARCPAPEPRT